MSTAIQNQGYQAPVFPTISVTPRAPSAPSVSAPPPPPAASGFDPELLPTVQLARAQANRGTADIDSLLAKSLSSLLVNYGSPSLASQLGQYGYALNPNDSAAAEANYKAGNATLARIDQARDLARQATLNRLAAHGLQFSGDVGYQLGQVEQGYGNSVYDATQDLLNQAFNLQQNALSQKGSLQGQITAALQAAWQNFIDNPGLYTAAPKNDGGGGGEAPQSTVEFTQPEYGPDAGYVPQGTPIPNTPSLAAPGGGTYTSGGGNVYYQSNAGPRGKKPLY